MKTKWSPEALWRLYCPPGSAGIAIRTTAGALNSSLGDDPDISIGRVQYIDFNKGFAGTYDRIFWKRKSLAHEAEVRAVITEHEELPESGVRMPVDLKQLISAIVISPFAPVWFVDVLKETISRFDLDVPVRQSELTDQPFF